MHVSSKTGDAGTCFGFPKGNSRSSGNGAKTLSRLAYKRFTIFPGPTFWSITSWLCCFRSYFGSFGKNFIPATYQQPLSPHRSLLHSFHVFGPALDLLAKLGESSAGIIYSQYFNTISRQKLNYKSCRSSSPPRIDVYTPSLTGRSHEQELRFSSVFSSSPTRLSMTFNTGIRVCTPSSSGCST